MAAAAMPSSGGGGGGGGGGSRGGDGGGGGGSGGGGGGGPGSGGGGGTIHDEARGEKGRWRPDDAFIIVSGIPRPSDPADAAAQAEAPNVEAALRVSERVAVAPW